MDDMDMGPPGKLTGYGSFTLRLKRLFKIAFLWLCIYPTLVLAACQAFYWLRYAGRLDLDTGKMLPPGLPGFFYHLTNWDGINILIHKFLELPLYVTLPLFSFCLLCIFYESALAIYFLICDLAKFAANFTGRISKTHNPDRRAEK